MKRTTLAALLIAMTAIAAFTLLLPERAVAPGPVADPHHAFAQDCFACHAPFMGASDERCMSCHKIASIGLTTVAGEPLHRAPASVPFHQQLADQNCLACHTEHEGIARLESSRRFSHDLILPEVRQSCTSCHHKPDDDLHAQFAGNCGECHEQKAWKPANFDHARYFPLTGEHRASCGTCHTDNNYRNYSCYGCHAHTPERIRAEHEEEGIRNFANCVECHRNGTKEEGEGREHGD